MMLFDAKKYQNRSICVALSGGIDSVCLLYAFKEQAKKYGITLSALHIEHGIRGEESVRDMHFCEDICEKWGIPLKIRRVNIPALAEERGGSMEQVARSVRYGAFHSVIEDGEADFVATAHHADDVAETVLFRLARGTGVSGMKAITEYGGIVRPLLACTRAEIGAYAEEKNLPYVEDSTNGDENYTRNYIRHTVLPAFEKIHGNAAKHLVEFATLAAEEDEYLQTLAKSHIVRIAGEEWVPVRLPDVLFHRACLFCLRQYAAGGYTRANLEEIARLRTAQSGKKIVLPSAGNRSAGRYAIREGDHIVFYSESGEEEPQSAETPFVEGRQSGDVLSRTPVETGLYTRPSPFSVKEHGPSNAEDIGKGSENNMRRLIVDLDAFPEECVVRARREGDMFSPYHAPRKTLKKFLNDRKIPSRLSKKLPVIAKENEIYVVVGVEIADSVKVTEKTVRRGIIG